MNVNALKNILPLLVLILIISTQSCSNNITLNDIDDGTIIQRNVLSRDGSITISGTYSGFPTHIQARVVKDGKDIEVKPWTNIVTFPLLGKFTGTLLGVPQGGWYNIQVRFENNHSVHANGTHKVGIGILIAVLGQSNAQLFSGIDNSLTPTPQHLVRMYNNHWAGASPGGMPGWHTQTRSGAILLGNRLVSFYNVPVGFLCYAVGLTGLNASGDVGEGYWLDTSANSIYDRFKKGLSEIGGKVEYIFWWQGENELMVRPPQTRTYLQDLGTFFKRVRTDVGDHSLPIIIVKIGLIGFPTTFVDWHSIKDQQQAYCASDSHAYCLTSTEDLQQDLAKEHHYGPHFDEPSYEKIGERTFQIIKYIRGDANWYKAPYIRSVKLVDKTHIEILIEHSGGTDFTPVDKDIYGFTVTDDSFNVTVSSARRQSSNKIRLTLAPDVSPNAVVRYLYGPDSSSTGHLNGVVIDNAAIPMVLNDLGSNGRPVGWSQ